ncbi:MAG TPA: caspase family protein [Streptosporangiaceae bacterium]|nr:caspase family protein [Streptosporangiaceae bacterium]
MPLQPGSPAELADRDGQRRWLIAAGTAQYDSLPEDDWLPSVPADLEQVTDLFCGQLGYQRALADVSLNPSRSELHGALSGWLTSDDRSAQDVVVLYYSGHGLTRGGRHYLLTRDYQERNPAGTALATQELVWILGEDSPVRHLLVMVDTCYAGQGSLDMGRVAAEVSGLRAPATATGTGWWFLTAARPADEAAEGAFAAALTEATSHARAGVLPPYVPLEELVYQVNAVFRRRGLAQQAQLGTAQSSGVPPFIINPRCVPGAPDEADLASLRQLARTSERDVTEHWDPRARGVTVASDPGSYFSGRTKVLRDLVSWLHDPDADHKARVVTGGPGSGKSAILARLVTLADPRLRTSSALEQAPPGTVPDVASIDVAIHARNRPLAELTQLIAAGLAVSAGRPAELAAALAASPRRRVVLIDAVDEAIAPEEVADKLLRPLLDVAARAEMKLVLGTRRPLLGALGPKIRPLDLDDPAYLNLADISDYVTRVLLAADEPDAPSAFRGRRELAEHVARSVARRANPTFLIARIVAGNLRTAGAPPDVTVPGWDEILPASVGDAFDAYLERFGSDEPRARDLFTPLAFAYGSGLPWEHVWARIASALADGRSYTDDDIRWLHQAGGAYLVEARDQGRSVYRLYHQALAEHLREQCPAGHSAQQRITRALTDLVPENAASGRDWPAAHPYITTNLADHAAAAGTGQLDDLLTDIGFPLAADMDRLLPVLASATAPAAVAVADTYRAAAHRLRARPIGEAASHLELSARQSGHHELAGHIATLPFDRPWTVPWGHWAVLSPSRLIGSHDSKATAVALAIRNGTPIAVSGGEDGTIRIWDLVRGLPVGPPLAGHAKPVRAVAVTEVDGIPVAVSVGDDGSVRTWDLLRVVPLISHAGPVSTLAVTGAPGHPIVVTAHGAELRTWDLIRGAGADPAITMKPRHALRDGRGLLRRSRPVTALAAGQDDGRPVAVTADEDGSVRIWDLDRGQAAGNRPSGDGVALPQGREATVEPPGPARLAGRLMLVIDRKAAKTTAVAFVDNRLQVWDLERRGLVAAADSVRTPALVLPAGRLGDRAIVLTSDGSAADVWDLSQQARLGRLTGHTAGIRSMAVGDVDGRPVAVTASEDRTIRAWDLDRITPFQETSAADDDGSALTSVTAVAAAQANGRSIVVTGGFQAARILDERDGTQIARLDGHFDYVEGVAATEILRLGYLDDDFLFDTDPIGDEPDDQPAVVTVSRDSSVRVWNTRGRQVEVWTPFYRPQLGGVIVIEDWVRCVAVCQLGERPLVVIGASDPIARAWLVEPYLFTPTVLGLRGHTDDVMAVAVGELAGQPVAVTGSRDATARIWDLDKGAAVGDPLTGHADEILAVAAGTLAGQPVAVTGSRDTTLRLWDLARRELLLPPLAGHTAPVEAVAIANLNGETKVISGSRDGSLRIWDPGTALSTVIPLDSPVSALATSSSGRLLVGTLQGILAFDFLPGSGNR